MFSYGKGKMTTKRAIRGKVIRWHGSTVRAETRSPKRSRNTGGRKKEDESGKKDLEVPKLLKILTVWLGDGSRCTRPERMRVWTPGCRAKDGRHGGL